MLFPQKSFAELEHELTADRYLSGTLNGKVLVDRVCAPCVVLQSVLRDEVREMCKWNVDRSSSSTKIRDMMNWSADIIEDIYYQLEVRKNVFADFLIKYW